MSDAEILALAARVRAQPDDERAIGQLDAARLRAGLGWHGEARPNGVFPFDPGHGGTEERGVYSVILKGERAVTLQLVYVPGGEAACLMCEASGSWAERSPRTRTPCPACGGTGKRAIAPFYVGRYPVTFGEWDAFATANGFNQSSHGDLAHRPATHVSHANALALSKLARNPILALVASMGAQEITPCPYCAGSKRIARRFPWGNEPPTPERCNGAMGVDLAGSTAPVVELRAQRSLPGEWGARLKPENFTDSVLVPARPLGASWCGAQDMAGNVWEWVAEGSAHGGSFRNDLAHTPSPDFGSRLGRWSHRQDSTIGADDVGFRVATSAS